MPASQSRASTSLRSLSSSFRSSLRSIRSRVAGSCAHTSDGGGDDDEPPEDGMSSSPSSSTSLSPSTGKASLWNRVRSVLRIGSMPGKRNRARREDGPPAEPVRPAEVVASVVDEEEVAGGRRPDDWFYQVEIRESDAARQRRLQRYEEMRVVREAECTFRPAVRRSGKSRRRSTTLFLERQRQFEDRRVSVQHYERAKQEWVLHDLSKEGHRNKVANPDGVWQRSVDWNNRRLHRRIFRQIDQRIGDLSRCPFEPVRDWTATKSVKMHDFQNWKRSVDDSHRSDFYRDLADVIQSISSETMPSH